MSVMTKSTLLFFSTLALGCREDKELVNCAGHDGDHSDEGYKWTDSNYRCEDPNAIETPFDLDSDSFFDFASLSTGGVISDFETTASDWSTTGAQLEVQVGDTDFADGAYVEDGDNEVFMADGPSPIDDGLSILALTRRWSIVGGLDDGLTYDCDIAFFTEDADSNTFDWVADDGASIDQVQLLNVMVHEMGHCVGLGDQDAPTLSDSVMFHSYTLGSVYVGAIPADDVEAAIMIYGEAS